MEPTFSQRQGIEPMTKPLQIESMDDDLRNRLWNVMLAAIWDPMRDRCPRYLGIAYPESGSQIDRFVNRFWGFHLKQRLDALDHRWVHLQKQFEGIYFGATWDRAYGFVEGAGEAHEFVFGRAGAERFREACNEVLRAEGSPYRFVRGTGLLAPFTNPIEVHAILEARETMLLHHCRVVHEHLDQALRHLASRENPNYVDSVGQSWRAVEAMLRLICHDDGLTGGKAINECQNKCSLAVDGSLWAALHKLHAYRAECGAGHPRKEETPEPQCEDARFMLVTCSAYTNYLAEKARKAKIDISQPAEK